MPAPYALMLLKDEPAIALGERFEFEERTIYMWQTRRRAEKSRHVLSVDIIVVGPGGLRWDPGSPVFLVSPTVGDSRDFFKDLFINSELLVQPPPESGSLNVFGTLQEELKEYRSIVSRLGRSEARRALEGMHDVAVEELKKKPAIWLPQIKACDAFRLHLLRSTGRYFAYRRAADILSGREKRSITLTRAAAQLVFRLPTFSENHRVQLDFGEGQFFDRRINVLIGENGVGKSQTLARLVSALADPGTHASLEPRGEFSRVIAFSGVPSQTSLPTSLRSQQNLQYRFFALSPQGQARQKSGRNRLTSALLDTLRDEEEIGGAKRINLFRLAIRSWLTFSQIALPLMQDESKQRKYVALSRLTSLKGSEFFEAHAEVDASQPPMFFARQHNTPSPLSSGQELFFRFALNLCASIEIGTLVLVDEPENHLHPNFITHLMALLRDILVRTGSFALVASHSAFVVREVTAKDVSIMSRAEDGSPTIRRPRLQTLGASVEAVSSYVFGDETVPALARLTVDALKDLPDVDFELTLNRLHTEFSNEAISHIRSEILKRQRGSFE